MTHERLVWVHHLIEIAVCNLAWASGCVETFGLVSDGCTCSGFASLCYIVFEGVLAPVLGGASSGVPCTPHRRSREYVVVVMVAGVVLSWSTHSHTCSILGFDSVAATWLLGAS